MSVGRKVRVLSELDSRAAQSRSEPGKIDASISMDLMEEFCSLSGTLDQLVDRYGASESPEIAGALAGIIGRRRFGGDRDEAQRALLDFVEKLSAPLRITFPEVLLTTLSAMEFVDASKFSQIDRSRARAFFLSCFADRSRLDTLVHWGAVEVLESFIKSNCLDTVFTRDDDAEILAFVESVISARRDAPVAQESAIEAEIRKSIRASFPSGALDGDPCVESCQTVASYIRSRRAG